MALNLEPIFNFRFPNKEDSKENDRFDVLEITKDGLITQIIQMYPELKRKQIKIIERSLDREGGVKIYFEIKGDDCDIYKGKDIKSAVELLKEKIYEEIQDWGIETNDAYIDLVELIDKVFEDLRSK